jgi:hypothetical protein
MNGARFQSPEWGDGDERIDSIAPHGALVALSLLLAASAASYFQVALFEG